MDLAWGNKFKIGICCAILFIEGSERSKKANKNFPCRKDAFF